MRRQSPQEGSRIYKGESHQLLKSAKNKLKLKTNLFFRTAVDTNSDQLNVHRAKRSEAHPADQQLDRSPQYPPPTTYPVVARLQSAYQLQSQTHRYEGHTILQIDVSGDGHLGRDGLKDEALLPSGRQRELDLAVQPTGSQQRGIQCIGSIGSHDDLLSNHQLHTQEKREMRTNFDGTALIKAIHLVQKLQQDALHLPIGARLRIEPLGSDRVHLVNKDDGGRVLPRQPKDVPHHPRPFAQVLLHKLGPDDADEGRGGVVRDGFDEHGLARAWWAVEQDAARWVDADLSVQVALGEGQLDGFADLLLLHVEAADVGVGHVGALVGGEHGDGRVGFGWEDVDEGVGVAVEGDGGGRLEEFTVDR